MGFESLCSAAELDLFNMMIDNGFWRSMMMRTEKEDKTTSIWPLMVFEFDPLWILMFKNIN